MFLNKFSCYNFLTLLAKYWRGDHNAKDKIDDILKLGDFVSIVHEPDYLKSMLEQLQDKYGIERKIFIGNEDFFPQVNPEGTPGWKLYYSIYLNAGVVY